MTNRIDTIIFDMDGTIFDTEQIYGRAWISAGVPDALYRSFIGTTPEFIKKALTDHGMDAATVQEQHWAYTYREIEENGVPLKPGAKECLAWLKENGYRTAIATSSSKALAQSYLQKTGMADLFDVVVSGQDLEHGKPAPDVFLHAAKEAGAQPKACVVVEDSFNGVRAGHAAGMITVMIPDVIQPDEEMIEKSDVILGSLHELPDYIAALG